MDFGLGLVLSFTDNATTGINNAVSSLGQLTQVAENATKSLDKMASLSALSVVSGQMGSSFTNMGRNIISTLGQVIGRVKETGQTLYYAQKQLDMLYASDGDNAGLEKMAQIQDYAKRSIFEFEDLIGVVTQLKTVGIEAFDSIASSAGNAYDVMTLASDLAAFNPNMRNVYGTGIQAAMGALKEYIAEGNAMSLKRGAGLDITGILGEEKGATMAERSRQVADLIEQLGMVGMTANLANSPMTKLSNMSDTLFQFLGMVSDSGVYDKFNSLITKFADYVMAIPDEELQSLAKTVGEALTAIMNPLDKVVDKILSFADGIRNLVSNNPKLAKMTTIAVALAGALFIITGTVLKATSALSGLTLLLYTSGQSFSTFGKTISTGLKTIMKNLLPLVATVGLLYLAWKTDFAGIKTMTTSFVSNVVSSFSTAKNAINDNVEGMLVTLYDLQRKGDFFSNFTISLMKVMQVIKSIAEAWDTNTLSEENYQKASELGVLPLIESLLDLKYRFEFFKQGFIDGWRQIGERVKTFITGFADKLDGTQFQSLIDGVAGFLEKLSSGDTQAWYEFGEKFAEFTAHVIAFTLVLKALDKTLGFVVKVASVFKIFGKIGGFFKSIFTSIKTALPFLTKLGGAVIAFGKNAVFAIQAVAGGASTVGEALAFLFPKIAKFFGGVVTFGKSVGAFFVKVFGLFGKLGGVLAKVGAFGKSLITGVVKFGGVILSAIGTVVTAILGAFGIVVSAPAWVVGAITVAIGAIIALIIKFRDEIWAGLCWLGDKIMSGLKWVGDKFVELGNYINEKFIQPIVQGFKDWWTDVQDTFSNVGEWFSEKFTQAKEGIISIFTGIPEFFSGIFNDITSLFSKIGSAVGDAINSTVVDAINWMLEGAVDLINGFIEGINNAISIINKIPGVEIKQISMLDVPQLAKGGVVDRPTLSVIGEAGKEAVVPLENNTEWVGQVAHLLSNSLRDSANSNRDMGTLMSIVSSCMSAMTRIMGIVTSDTGEEENDAPKPVTQQNNTTNNGGNDNSSYMTHNNSNVVHEGDTDNSVVFEEGSIVIHANGASDEEAVRMAKKIIAYIKRQKELEDMLAYN